MLLLGSIFLLFIGLFMLCFPAVFFDLTESWNYFIGYAIYIVQVAYSPWRYCLHADWLRWLDYNHCALILTRAKNLPGHSTGQVLIYINTSDQVQQQGQQNKGQSEPLGGLGQLCVPGLGLALGEEGLRAAGDGAGKSCALTALHQNNNGDGQAGEKLKNGENDGEYRHLFQSFRYFTN